MSKTVVIDAGHGGHDGGATANGLKEKDLTLDIAKRIQSKLKGSELKVIMTRSTDKYLTLSERANIANRNKADLFVSVHINSGGGTGFESFIYSGNVSANTQKLQETIHRNIMDQMDVADRGEKRANFAVVRQTSMPAVLTENLFIDTKADAAKLKDSKQLDKIAQGHADGIIEYLGIKGKQTASKSKKKKPAAKPKPQSTPKANLTVDSKWGKKLTRSLQNALGTPVDGIISGQLRNSVTNSLYGGVRYGGTGSPMVEALQRRIGEKADGLLGPGTVRGLQRYLGTPVDGVLSRPNSVVVGELQKRLNAGTF